MTDSSAIYAVRRVVPDRTTSDTAALNSLDASRGGELYTYDWKQRRVAEGKGFVVNVGAFSTPITGGGAGTVLDLDQPEFVINVESGKVLVPLRFHIQTQQPLLATDADEVEILIAVDRTAKWAGDGTFTAETAFNMNTASTNSYSGSVGSAFSADMLMTTGADAVLGIELAHSVNVGDVNGTPGFAAFNTKHELLYEPAVSPFIVGPAAVIGYWGGTVATTGFAQLFFLELNATEISS